jgi:hypothetical protein
MWKGLEGISRGPVEVLSSYFLGRLNKPREPSVKIDGAHTEIQTTAL